MTTDFIAENAQLKALIIEWEARHAEVTAEATFSAAEAEDARHELNKVRATLFTLEGILQHALTLVRER